MRHRLPRRGRHRTRRNARRLARAAAGVSADGVRTAGVRAASGKGVDGMRFEPIAIVERGCVLPDALDPDTFWDNIAAGRVSLDHAPDGRWNLPHDAMLTTPGSDAEGT